MVSTLALTALALLMPPVPDDPLYKPGDLVVAELTRGDGIGVILEIRWSEHGECWGYDIQFELARYGVKERFVTLEWGQP